MNSNNARQVWQRVTSPAEQQSLQSLLQTLEQDIACLRRYRNRENIALLPLLEQLEQGYLGQVHALCAVAHLPRRPRGSQSDLYQCYRNALERLSGFQLRSADPAYAPAFRQMAAQTEQHCLWLLQLIGHNPKCHEKNGRS